MHPQKADRWFTFEFYSTIIQALLLAHFLPVIFQDEHAQVTLQGWVIRCGAGRLLLCTYKRFRRQSNPLPQAVSVSPGLDVGEARSDWLLRFGWILEWIWTSLDVLLNLWFAVGIGIVYLCWTTGQAPHLNWMCRIFIGVACFLVVTVGIMMCIWCGISVLLGRLAKSPSGDGEGCATSIVVRAMKRQRTLAGSSSKC